jgi:mannan endo-1,4-beta-mannosidase
MPGRSISLPKAAKFVRPRRMLLSLAIVLATLGAATFAGRAPVVLGGARLIATGGFVRASGTQLYVGGTPWRFTGYNAYQTTSASPGYQCGGASSDAQLDQLFAQMQNANGSIAMRTWFFQSYQNGNSANFSQFDRVLTFASAHGIRVIATLVNQWTACDSGAGYKTASWYASGYKSVESGHTLSFRDYAALMAAHYRNDPRIAFWQLVNEAETKDTHSGGCAANGAALLRAFGDDVAGVMKAADPNHLVSLGTMGGSQCGGQGSEYQYIHAGAIDICEMHDYHTSGMGSPPNDLTSRLAQCKALNKPLFVGESGLQNMSLTARASEFSNKLAALFGGGGAGFLIWSKHLANDGGFSIGPGDPTEAVMLAEAKKLGGQGPIGGLIVTDGDPAPNGSTPGARVAGTHAPGSRAGAGPTATLAAIPFSAWLLHRVR